MQPSSHARRPAPVLQLLLAAMFALPLTCLAASEEELAQARMDRQHYEQLIASLELENSQGAWRADLSEAWMGMGHALRTLSLYDEAAEAYDTALQSTRINAGLNSLDQLPMLEALLETSELRQDWEAMDAFANLIYYVHRKNFPVGDARRLDALELLAKWKMRASENDLLDGFRNQARQAADLYKREIRLLETMDYYEGRNLALASLYLGEARASLVIAQQVYDRPLRDYQTGAPQTITTQRCRSIRLPDGRVTQICETVEVPNMDNYLEPVNRKNQELLMNMDDIRGAITNAYDALQVENSFPEEREAMLMQVQETTRAYNAFVTNNSL